MEFLEVSNVDGVATVTLNKPAKKNAIDETGWVELADAFRGLGVDGSVRAIVVTGAGGDFCSGADLSGDGARLDPATSALVNMDFVGAAASALHHLPQPTIAKVRGVAVGAGMNLALGCDLTVAAKSSRFSEIFSRRSLSLDFGGSWLVPRRVGLHRAKELAFFADILSADEAYEFGLLNRVVADDELDAFVDGWARRLAGGPTTALRSTKRLLDNAATATMDQALANEGTAQVVNFGTADTREAMEAFVQRREPTFTGALILGALILGARIRRALADRAPVDRP